MTYEETTEHGVFEVDERKNGIKIKTLKTPSASYLATQEASKQQREEIRVEKEKILTKERAIKHRLRTIAIQSLKDSGDWLDEWGNADANGET